VPQVNSSFDLAYQYLDAKSTPTGSTQAGLLDYAPAHRVYFRAHTLLGQIGFLDLYAVYVGARQDPAHVTTAAGVQGANVMLPGYLVANGRIGANVLPGLSISLLAQNLFNSQYEEMYGFPAPGLRLFSEVKFVY